MVRQIAAYVASACLLGFFSNGCRRTTTAGMAGADSSAAAATAAVPGHRTSTPVNQRSSAPTDTAGWRPLFDGKTTAGWRGFRQSSVPTGWQVVDSALTRVGPATDLITTDQFENFELTLEWKISKGGNSGIFYHATEEGQHVYESGPEMQVLDDARHEDGKSRLTAAGSLFALYPSPAGVVHPAETWNQVRILVKGPHVEQWLNGVKVVEVELWSPDWDRRVKASKFAAWPIFGRAHKGHIGLQDHGNWVAYRNIRIRVLP